MRTKKRWPWSDSVTGTTRRNSRIDRLVAREREPDPGEDEKRPEDVDDEVVTHQQGAADDEERAKDEGPEDAIEQHAVLVAVRNAEVAEDDDEHEDVVDRQGLFDDVAGQKLQSNTPGRGLSIEARYGQQPRIGGECPEGILVESEVEQQGERNPHDDPDSRLFERDLVGLAMEHSQVDRQQRADARGEGDVDPPVLDKREKLYLVHCDAPRDTKKTFHGNSRERSWSAAPADRIV